MAHATHGYGRGQQPFVPGDQFASRGGQRQGSDLDVPDDDFQVEKRKDLVIHKVIMDLDNPLLLISP